VSTPNKITHANHFVPRVSPPEARIDDAIVSEHRNHIVKVAMDITKDDDEVGLGARQEAKKSQDHRHVAVVVVEVLVVLV
jgi:hypothetical protein